MKAKKKHMHFISHFRDTAIIDTFCIMFACCNTFYLSPSIIMKGFELKELDVPVL